MARQMRANRLSTRHRLFPAASLDDRDGFGFCFESVFVLGFELGSGLGFELGFELDRRDERETEGFEGRGADGPAAETRGAEDIGRPPLKLLPPIERLPPPPPKLLPPIERPPSPPPPPRPPPPAAMSNKAGGLPRKPVIPLHVCGLVSSRNSTTLLNKKQLAGHWEFTCS